MELGCTRRGFGRDVQPAAPNRPRCWALVGLTLGAILVEALFAQRSRGLWSVGLAVSRWAVTGPLVGLEETPSTWRRRIPAVGGWGDLAWERRNGTWLVLCDDDLSSSRGALMEGLA